MSIDWPNVFTAVISFVIGLIAKTLLDHNLAFWFVKYLNNTPVRSIYRSAPHKMSGDWEQQWDFNSSKSYSQITERHSHTTINQLGKYIYGEFYSRNEKYYIFGEIRDNYIIGHWGDVKDKLGYFGSFELRIINSKSMTGKWIGHSKTTQEIYGDGWNWNKKS